MARTIDDFWKLLQEIQGTSTDLTDSVKAIAKNEKTVSERLFSNIIDQNAYNSRDYQRIRQFLRDWYAAHRSLTSFQANVSDVYQMPNDQLDDLFQSFGYNLSSSLRDPISNNPPLNKINFFLDLINLYKIKGTPQALIDVLQYYGIVDVDLYELSLQYEERVGKDHTDFIFKGKPVAGTTGDSSPIYLPFDLLTQGDPHWLQTEAQIRSLITTNKINFPSQSPYFAVKPLFDEEAIDAHTGILQRQVQDQYAIWEAAGFPPEDTTPVLPQDAVITITGDTCSLLTIYLSAIYTFNQEFNVGAPATRFVCYDGTNVTGSDIIAEFKALTSKPFTRDQWKTRYLQYLDTFSRDIALNFLQTRTDAGYYLGILNPTVKANLDILATDFFSVLGSILRDLGEWVRANISYGFINMSYILIGMDALFGQLRDVIEFFKPYRARIVPLELLQLRNRLLNGVIVSDSFGFDNDVTFHDYLVGDSFPCCINNIDATCSQFTSPREYYDCGSYHDIGAVTDIAENVQISLIDVYRDYMKCPTSDTTGYVISEILSGGYELPQTVNLTKNSSSVAVLFDVERADANYALIYNIYNETDAIVSMFPGVVTAKNYKGFEISFAEEWDTSNYFFTWDLGDGTANYGVEVISIGSNQVTVNFSEPRTNPNYSIGLTLENLTDATVAYFLYSIIEKSINGFTVEFSDVMPTANYSLGWVTFERGRFTSPPAIQDGWIHIPNGASTITVPFDLPYELFDNFNVSLAIVNTDDTSVSSFSYVVRSKDLFGFTVELSGPVETDNYYLSWSLPISAQLKVVEGFRYRQTGGYRNYDDEGTFDCTYAFDIFDIEIEDFLNYMLQENGSYLLQEDGFRILL